MQIPTVKIKQDTPRGFKIINEADFNPATDVLFGAEERDEFDGWNKADIIDALEGHGIKADKRKSVDTLRAELVKVVYL